MVQRHLEPSGVGVAAMKSAGGMGSVNKALLAPLLVRHNGVSGSALPGTTKSYAQATS